MQSRRQQLFDSALPNGGYAHSQGLEGLVQEGTVQDEADLRNFLSSVWSEALVHCDLPLVRIAHHCASEARFERLLEIDRIACAIRPTSELRKAASQMGKQTYQLYLSLVESLPEAQCDLRRCGEFFDTYQLPVVMGTIAALMGISETDSMHAFAYQSLQAMVTPAIKLLQFGPTQAQRVVFDMSGLIPDWVEASRCVALDEIGCCAPLWDIASANHAFFERRLYIS